MSPSLFRGFAAKVAPLWGWMEVLAVVAFCPRALGLVAFWSSSIFLMLDEKPHVFVGVHTRLKNV
ncbi:MAG: hypothetical protein SOX03_03175 [Collinsella sp.]|uniref:hypothetical protein n=1 Tax=Collinsella sp. LCP19S3_B11 TaxID=3438754 RepID=UPI002A8B96D3|nr:hypothetical protein [Collinsella sp.]MCI7620576.1 hypothetical protein [Collinsella sp.]MCI7632088.1 hypothetical protein [Collinsella sp.]MCI7746097.1 hypothetical protein [Collinsella sp.]MDY3220685.1 hypothetical protein [Collinsella sp.]